MSLEAVYYKRFRKYTRKAEKYPHKTHYKSQADTYALLLAALRTSGFEETSEEE